MSAMKALWLDTERRERVAFALQRREPWIVSLAAAAANNPADNSPEDPGPQAVVRLAVNGWLNFDPAAAGLAAEQWCQCAAAAVNSEDLQKAHVALAGAVMTDCRAGKWGREEQASVVANMRGLLASFFDISPGNPHAVGNNWWAVTHSAIYCLASALQVLGDPAPVRGRTPQEIEEWAWVRLRAFLGHFGPQGAYHEGLGYMGYTCSNLLPAVLLRMARSGGDVMAGAPGLARMAALIFTGAIEGATLSDETGKREGWGRMLSWNDAGLGFLSGSAPLLSICLAPAPQRAGFRSRWDILSGHLRPDGKVDQFGCALFFHAAFYPGATADAAASVPPLQVCDPLHGLWMARNRCRDSSDTVAGAYARSRHPGGHTQHDAGSIRFSALGWDWVLGGGQARPDARWQSRLVPSDHDNKSKAECGGVIWSPAETDPSVYGMDLRPVHRAYSERYVALRPGDVSQMAVLDLVDDHRNDRYWLWCLTFSPEFSCETREDGFRLTAPDGAVMDAVFLLDRPEAMELTHTPASRRTFVSRRTVEYPGRPVLVARFPGPSLNILVSMTVTSTAPSTGSVARLAVPGRLDIAVGDGVWERPFGWALPAECPGRLCGQCPAPAF